MKSSRITIIGFGNVGKALFYQLSEHGFNITSVFNRSEISYDFRIKFSGVNFQKEIPHSSDKIGTHIFITVSDDVLEIVSKELAARISDFSGKYVFHCSGNHTSSILQPLKEKGAKIASFHPIKAVTPKTSSFKNTWFDMEGDEEALKFLSKLANAMGAKSFPINPESKPFLHVAAVVASNYLVVLAEAVSKISKAGGIPEEEALKSIIPLMENTLQNIEELGPMNALTGPVSRGDINTVKQHLQILQNRPDLISLYKVLGLEAVRLSEEKQGETSALKEIKNLLS